jgi:hypothetical protein
MTVTLGVLLGGTCIKSDSPNALTKFSAKSCKHPLLVHLALVFFISDTPKADW